MKIVVEVERDVYDQVTNAWLDTTLSGAIDQIEVRQQDGLLTKTFRCRYAETLGWAVAHTLGLPEGRPNLRLWLAPEREDHHEHDGRPGNDRRRD